MRSAFRKFSKSPSQHAITPDKKHENRHPTTTNNDDDSVVSGDLSITANTTLTDYGKPVFFHYMIGTIHDHHCQKDIQDAQSLGADAFALNIDCLAPWAMTTVESLFKWADHYNFRLFFSFDMTPGKGFSDPTQFVDFLKTWAAKPAYFFYRGRPLVSTFRGASIDWKNNLQRVMARDHQPIFLVPAFEELPASTSFFNRHPHLDGIMNWNSWPHDHHGKSIVPTDEDSTYLTACRQHEHGHGHKQGNNNDKNKQKNDKTFMMAVSTQQFKHIDHHQNWYRRGQGNLEYRLEQVLAMRPDLLQFVSWNDAGECHYMGNIWPEPIAGSCIPHYTDGYDHTGYWEVLGPFIRAYKNGERTTEGMVPTNGKPAQGVLWHHTMLVDAVCENNCLGLERPRGVHNAEDSVNGIILVASGLTSLRIVVRSGPKELGSQMLSPGFNRFAFPGMTTGKVRARVQDTASNNAVVLAGAGPAEVSPFI